MSDEKRKDVVNLILVNELKGKFVAKGYTQSDVAKMLEITPKTLSVKLKNGVFGSDEVEKLIEILDIEKPLEIFFVKQVTCCVTNKQKGSD